jgi:hypothetical protein
MHNGVCVCVSVYTYIDMVFRDNIFQAANMFSVTNATYFKRNCEFNVLFFFWKRDGQNLKKVDKIIPENSKIPIFLLFLSLMQLLVI